MNTVKLIFCLTVCIGIGVGCSLEENKPVDSTEQEEITRRDTLVESAALEIIANAYYCNLITVNEDGVASSRIMEPFPPEKNWEIWMATNPRSRKVTQIEKNNQVTLHYFDQPNLGYVSLMGKAYLVHENDKKEQYWKEEWNAFYANRTDAYLLIKFVPERIEVVSVKHGLNGDSETWEPANSRVGEINE